LLFIDCVLFRASISPGTARVSFWQGKAHAERSNFLGVGLAESQLLGNSLLAPAHNGHRLAAQLAAAPRPADLGVVVVQVLGDLRKVGQFVLVLLADIDESQSRRGLLVDNGAEPSLALDDDVRDVHLAAQRRQHTTSSIGSTS